MRLNRLAIGIVLVALILVPVVALAATFESREGTVRPMGPIEDDLFVAGESVVIDEDVRDDIFAAGRQIYISARAGSDVIAAAENVTIEGEVGDDIMAAGSIVRVSGQRAGDVMAAGNIVEITSGTEVQSVYLAGQSVTLAGHVKGNARVAAERVTVAKGTVIDGNLYTYGRQGNEPIIEDGAQILGESRHFTEEPRPDSNYSIWNFVTSWLSWFVAALVFLKLFTPLSYKIVSTGLTKAGVTFGVGLAWVLGLLPVVIILALTVIGLPISMLILFFSIAHLILSQMVAVLLTGSWIMKYGFKRTEDKLGWQHVLLGAFVFKVIGAVPYVGWLVGLVISLIALGSAGWTIFHIFREKQLRQETT